MTIHDLDPDSPKILTLCHWLVTKYVKSMASMAGVTLAVLVAILFSGSAWACTDRLTVFHAMDKEWIYVSRPAEPLVPPVKVCAHIARTDEQHACGYQFVPAETIRQSAILFVFPKAGKVTFHMRNVLADLDILFFDKDKSLSHFLTMEMGGKWYPSKVPIEFALETYAGFADEEGFVEGLGRLERTGTKCCAAEC